MSAQQYNPQPVSFSQSAFERYAKMVCEAAGLSVYPAERVTDADVVAHGIGRILKDYRVIRSRLRQTLEFMQHKPDCDKVANGIDGDCQCGLLRLIELIEENP